MLENGWGARFFEAAPSTLLAPDEKSAEPAAVAEFKVRDDMRRRLVIRPNDE